MLNLAQLENIITFLRLLRDKNYFSFYEVKDGKIFIEFTVDEYKELDKLIKDWLLFHSEIISFYDVEWTDDNVCRYNLYLNADGCDF